MKVLASRVLSSLPPNSSKLLIISLLMVMVSPHSLAQDPVTNGTNVGFPSNGLFSGSNFDSVQVNNGNLHVEISLWALAGRGLPTAMQYGYNSKNWRVAQTCNPQGDCTNHVSGGTPIGLISPFSYSTRHGNHQPEAPNDRWWFFSYVLTEPDGTSHHFVPDEVNKCFTTPCPTVKLYADDGSGWQIGVNSQNGVVTGPMINKNGTSITIASDGSGSKTIEDTNGNQLLQISSFTGGSYADTLGREMHFNPGTVQLDGAYYDSNGVLRSITVQNQSVTFQTQLCQFARFPDPCTEFTGARNDPHIITLPDGTSYTIEYVQNSYGQPASITLPTGGQISYTWRTAIDASGPLVATRTVTADGQSATWSYSYSYTFNSFTKVAQINATTVTDPGGNDTVTSFDCNLKPGFSDTYFILLEDPPCYQNRVEYFSGTGGGRTLLKTVTTNYLASGGTVVPIRETTTWAQGNLVSKIETDWDSSSVSTGRITWRNVKARREYSFGVGSPGTLVRTTSFNYLHELNGAYLAANIADRVVDEIVTDAGGNWKANTHTIFDDTNDLIASLGNAPSHNAAKGTAYFLRGNPTRVQSWLDTNGSWLTTTNVYDDLGNLRTTTDPGNHATSFSYDDNWLNNKDCIPAGKNTQAFPTLVTNALNQQSMTRFFYCTGLAREKRDANDIAANRAGTYFTYDLMNRNTQIDFPDGGQTQFFFNAAAPLWKQQRVKIDSTGAVSDFYAQFDGMGRIGRTARSSGDSDGPWDQVDTCYDGLGRVSYQSYPYRDQGFIASKACSNAARPGDTFAYDALSRPTQTTRTDNGTVVTQYPAANQTIVTDEAGKKRKSQSDALGRLTNVWEPDAAGSLVNQTLYLQHTRQPDLR